MTVVLVADLKLWISGTGANANAIAIHYSGFYTPYVFIIFSTSTGAWEIYRSTNRVETHPKPPANLPRNVPKRHHSPLQEAQLVELAAQKLLLSAMPPMGRCHGDPTAPKRRS